MTHFDPDYYKSHASGIECIEINSHLPYALGCLVKYLWRVDDRDVPASNVGKALWYVNCEIQRRYTTVAVTRRRPLPRQYKEAVPVVLAHEPEGWRRDVLTAVIQFDEYEPTLEALNRAREILEKVAAELG